MNTYFDVIPRDIVHIICLFVRKRPLQDSNADEAVVITEENHVKYYRNRKLMWRITSNQPTTAHVILTPNVITAFVYAGKGRYELRTMSRTPGAFGIPDRMYSFAVRKKSVIVYQAGEWMLCDCDEINWSF